MQNGYISSFYGRMPEDLLNDTLFLRMDHARVQPAAWVEDHNQERPHSTLGYAPPAAFSAEQLSNGLFCYAQKGLPSEPLLNPCSCTTKQLCPKPS